MTAKEFDFDGFLKFCEEKEDAFRKFAARKEKGVVLTQCWSQGVYDLASTKKETALEAWLDALTFDTKLHSDVAYTYLSPWAGVPVYANAFGAKLYYSGNAAAQSLCCYDDAEDVKNVPMPKAGECEMMQTVLEYIRYFKKQTHGLLPMSLTDTQSPCDTASLILDACEYFAVSKEEPEMLTDFMEKVTRSIIEFTEMQMEEIGENLVLPGHSMISARGMKGIAMSDDNMAFLSPDTYDTICRPYNEEVSRHFGGVALHSCGVVSQNLESLRDTAGLTQFDFKITDFEPNDAALIAKVFDGTDVIIKPCVRPEEDLGRLIPLLKGNVKTIVQVMTTGTIDEMNRQYDKVAEYVQSI